VVPADHLSVAVNEEVKQQGPAMKMLMDDRAASGWQTVTYAG
jgi:hypothetical protein